MSTRDNELKLRKYAENRSASLRNEIAMDNQDLVWYVAKRFTSSIATKEDFFQAGMVGLICAIEKFDVEKGTALSTYAVPYIQNEMRNLIDNPDYIEDREGFEPKDEYISNPLQMKLSQLYDALFTEEERNIMDVLLRTNDEPAFSVNDIAKLFNIPSSRVRELYASGIEKLTKPWVCWYIKLLKEKLN